MKGMALLHLENKHKNAISWNLTFRIFFSSKYSKLRYVSKRCLHIWMFEFGLSKIVTCRKIRTLGYARGSEWSPHYNGISRAIDQSHNMTKISTCYKTTTLKRNNTSIKWKSDSLSWKNHSTSRKNILFSGKNHII